VRQGLEEEEKKRELPEDMVHKKMGKILISQCG
jgi:hypothetical protein